MMLPPAMAAPSRTPPALESADGEIVSVVAGPGTGSGTLREGLARRTLWQRDGHDCVDENRTPIP